MKIKITKATLVQLREGPDHISLYTELPNTIWPFDGVAVLKLEAARGTGKDYLGVYLKGVKVEVIVEHTEES